MTTKQQVFSQPMAQTTTTTTVRGCPRCRRTVMRHRDPTQPSQEEVILLLLPRSRRVGTAQRPMSVPRPLLLPAHRCPLSWTHHCLLHDVQRHDGDGNLCLPHNSSSTTRHRRHCIPPSAEEEEVEVPRWITLLFEQPQYGSLSCHLSCGTLPPLPLLCLSLVRPMRPFCRTLLPVLHCLPPSPYLAPIVYTYLLSSRSQRCRTPNSPLRTLSYWEEDVEAEEDLTAAGLGGWFPLSWCNRGSQHQRRVLGLLSLPRTKKRRKKRTFAFCHTQLSHIGRLYNFLSTIIIRMTPLLLYYGKARNFSITTARSLLILSNFLL